jgi:hypothetical protein
MAYVTTKGDFQLSELQGAKPKYRNEGSFVNKHSLSNLWQDNFLNAEPAVAKYLLFIESTSKC